MAGPESAAARHPTGSAETGRVSSATPWPWPPPGGTPSQWPAGHLDMQAAAYDRARKLLTPRGGAVIWANLLGVVHSFLILLALLVGGAIAALVISRGETWPSPVAGPSGPH